jgi:hypothetical protein
MKSDMENKDWLDDYMSLKQVSKANPFTVPAGYFDDLGDRIVSYKNLDELKNKGILGGFTVPENYFEDLADNIQSRINIESALITENTGFTVPENYFEELSAKIQSRINIEDALNNKDAGFTVPQGYFDNLEQQIQSRIFVEEALNEHAENFTVPHDYFNTLNKDILNKTVNLESAKNKGIVRKLFASAAFKYATAACFAIAIGGGILITELNNPVDAHKSSFLHKQLANLPVDDIKNYLQLNVDAGDTQQTAASDGVTIDESSLKNALQNDADSIQ